MQNPSTLMYLLSNSITIIMIIKKATMRIKNMMMIIRMTTMIFAKTLIMIVTTRIIITEKQADL